MKRRRHSARPPSATGTTDDPTAAIGALFARALAHHQAMDLAAAEPLYRQIISIKPVYARSLHLLGVLAAQSQRFAEAADLIGSALALEPEMADAHNNLGAALKALGRLAEALAVCRRAIELQPEHAEAYNNLGAIQRDLGRPAEAVAAYGTALRLKPDYPEAHNNLCVALTDLGRHSEAAAAARTAIALQPGSPEPHNNLGVALTDTGRLEEAADAFRMALTLRPDYAEADNNLGVALQALGRTAEALARYERAADTARPGFENPLIHKALLLVEAGDSAEALALLDRAVRLNPRAAYAWYLRRDLKTFGPDDPDIPVMTEALAAAETDAAKTESRMHLHFALGKAWMDVGNDDLAFTHLHAGNRLKRASFVYDVDADGREMAAIARAFRPEMLNRLSGLGDPSELPIFVVGMPRSGTTLVEQILASHPAVHGAGELTLFEGIAASVCGGSYPGSTESLTPQHIVAAGYDYVQRVAALAPEAGRIVDKLPGNFLYAGLIHLALPNARIVHCRRDPVDTCLSCYTKIFDGARNCTYDLRELGRYYRHYERLMDHWRNLLPPDRFFEIGYEAIVADLEGEARRLLDSCGLSWNPACLSFHRTRRPVKTASAAQVRQPLYPSSVGRWHRHAPHLEPLLAALRQASHA